MLIKNKAIIEVEVKGREYRLECASESTLDDVVQAISALNACVSERINTINEQMQKKEETEEKVIEPEIIME